MKIKWLLKAGYLVPILFWSTTLICGFLMNNYNHFTNMVSELGEIGTNTQIIFTFGLVLTAIFSIVFILGLIKICKKINLNIFPILLLFMFSFSILGAGLFPFPLRLHEILGMPSILLVTSPLLAAFLWKSDRISNIKLFSVVSILLMSLGFLVFLPTILSDFIGLKQRFFHIGWSCWFIYLSNTFITVFNKLENKRI